MLRQEHHPAVFTNSPTFIKRNCRENGGMLKATVQRLLKQAPLVVICVQICWTHDEREKHALLHARRAFRALSNTCAWAHSPNVHVMPPRVLLKLSLQWIRLKSSMVWCDASPSKPLRHTHMNPQTQKHSPHTHTRSDG